LVLYCTITLHSRCTFSSADSAVHCAHNFILGITLCWITIIIVKNGKEAIPNIFLYEFKLGSKIVETNRKINEVRKLQTNGEYNDGFKNFVTESLEDKESRKWHITIDNEQLKTIIESTPLKTIREIAQELKLIT